MKYKFHYGDKVKILHGFYAGNKGIVSDVTHNLVDWKIDNPGGWFRSPTYKARSIQRQYKIHIIVGERFTDVWIIEQHLEKA